MTPTTSRNLKILIAQLLVTELMMVGLRVFDSGAPVFAYWYGVDSILAPVSILVFAPYWLLLDGSYGALAAVVSLIVAFLAIEIFSIKRNHIVFGCVCLFIFNFLGLGFIAAGV